jgi:hypothetical protein
LLSTFAFVDIFKRSQIRAYIVYHLNRRMHTADDLLHTADAMDVPRSRPWIRKLVKDGLLDQPENHGIAGQRGGRQPATWPPEQFQLFVALLDAMHEGVAYGELCDIPVGIWLDRGPSDVPVRQVRRALRASRRQPSKRAARRTARLLAELFAGGADLSRRDSEELIDAFVGVAITGALDRDALLNAARRVTDPEDVGRTIGPLGPWIGHEGLVFAVEAHLTAWDRLDEFDESTFEAARAIHQQVTAMYRDLQPRLTSDREVGAAFKTLPPEHLRKRACRHVLASLGVIELSRQGAIPNSLTSSDADATRAIGSDDTYP